MKLVKSGKTSVNVEKMLHEINAEKHIEVWMSVGEEGECPLSDEEPGNIAEVLRTLGKLTVNIYANID
ncbi:hypothetical protein JCM15519_22500 [Fundidesulfovibrio butyratiphilus]